MRLIQKAVAALTLPVGKTDHFEWDDEVRGFGYRLRLAAGGKINRTWTVQYRHGGATRRLLLGSAAVLGAEQARVMAKRALGRVANGADPQADRLDRRGKDRHTLKATVADYLAAKERELRPRTRTERARYLAGRYFGPLHALPLDQITRKDVGARLTRISFGEQLDCGRTRPCSTQCAVWLGACTRPVRSQPGGGYARAEGRQAARARARRQRTGANLARVRRRRSRSVHQATDLDRVPTARNRPHVLERV